MNFGFSYVGLVYLVMLMIPNLIWVKNKPEDYERHTGKENRVLLAFERTGEVLVSIVALIFRDFNLRPWDAWCMWLVLSFALMLLYEAFWIRYFKSERTMRDFYRSFAGIPVAGATLPVAAFFLLGVYGRNDLMLLSTVILGIGHIGIHLAHSKESVPKSTDTKLSPGMKILSRIILILVLFGVYYHIVAIVAFLRVGHRDKMGDEIQSTAAVWRLLLDNPSVFFTGEADAAYACVWTPEMRRWNGLYLWLRAFTFTLGWDAKEWSIYVFTEKEEDVEKIRRELASMISELDAKSSVLCVRQYHVYFIHSWPGPSPWYPWKLAKMPFYADYRLALDQL